MLVGEQPGDEEDLSGHPFVGPAGKLLDRALDEARHRPRRRVRHQRRQALQVGAARQAPHSQEAQRGEIAACRPWLDTEIALVKPRAIVCLGATAAQALLGRQFKVTAHRGEFVPSPLAPLVLATVHPSSLLRAPDEETRHREIERFIDDLRAVARALSC